MNEPTPAMNELERKREEARKQAEAEEERLLELVPIPVGWSILIAIPQAEDTYESGILKATETRNVEEIMSSIGKVLDVGPQAYSDKDRFGDQPWCKVGDFVMFRPHSGTRFRLGKQEYRLLNDDSVEAVVPDPSVVESA